MSKLKNIVIVNDFDYIQGGASKVAINTANLLCDKFNVYFFSGATSEEMFLDDKVNLITTNQCESLKNKNKIAGFFNGLYNIKARKKLAQLLMCLNRDETVVHIHGWTKVLSSSVFDVCWKMGFNTVLTMHDYFTACPNGGYYNYQKNEICKLCPLSFKCIICNCDSRNYFFKVYRILRQFLQNKIVKLTKRLDNVISISKFSEDILKDTLNDSTTVYRVYNPIDFDKDRKIADYTKNKYFLYVGRVSKEKGVGIFCKAVSDAKVKGIVVGNGDEYEVLKSKYTNVEFVGWKNSKEVKEYMKNAKALIVPSRWYEGAPLTPLEAMQYGIPCISSECNATIEYIENGKNGLIFHDVNELKDILLNFAKYNLKFSPASLISRFSEEKYISNVIKVYEKVLCKEGVNR